VVAPLLPGFVNDFAMAPPKKAKGKARASTSHFEQSQGMRERDLDPPSPPRTQIDERMEVDRHYGDNQVGFADHPEVDLHMDFGDDVKALQPQHVAGSSRIAKPFDWLGWVGFSLFLLCSLRSGLIVSLYVDETTGSCAFDVANCPQYNPTPTHSAIVRWEPRDYLPPGLHIPDGRRSRKRGQLRSHCTRRCRFTGTNSKYTPNQRSG